MGVQSLFEKGLALLESNQKVLPRNSKRAAEVYNIARFLTVTEASTTGPTQLECRRRKYDLLLSFKILHGFTSINLKISST